MTIEQLLADQNALLLRIADGVDRLVVLAEKDAGVALVPTKRELLLVPVDGPNSTGKFHALTGDAPSCNMFGRTFRYTVALSRALPASQVPDDLRCRHTGCRNAISDPGSLNRFTTPIAA